MARIVGTQGGLSQEDLDAFVTAIESGPVIVSPDHGIDLPLWGRSVSPFDLPAALLDRLALWQQEFDNNYDSFTGWKSHEVRATWTKEAHNLEFDLRRALPEDVELTVDLWPVESE